MQGVTSYRVDLILKSLRNQLNLYPAYFYSPTGKKSVVFWRTFLRQKLSFFFPLGYFRRSRPTLVVAK